MTARHDYIRDGGAIYARSFAIIRAEADLSRFTPEEARIAVRMIHGSGMVEIAEAIRFGGGFAQAGRAALLAGAPILCDSKMVAHGITRSRLPARNEIICTLDAPETPERARVTANTRSAAALDLWGERLAGAVVAIGNAPTALFHLLELLDAGAPLPAAVIGLAVGFVGAAESKAALAADGRVPFLIVEGRRGGSAMAVSAVNALGSEAGVSARAPGTLFTLGMGPGDPELLTLKAARILGQAPVVAFFAKAGQRGHARAIADGRIRPGVEELRFDYPVTVEIPHRDGRYIDAMAGCYAEAAGAIAVRLERGLDVALLCEGDPFFYGSSMYLFDRLRDRFPMEIVPGVLGMSGCWAEAQLPMTHGDDVLVVVPGTMAEAALHRSLLGVDAAVIMKLGRNLAKVRAVLTALGRADRAIYVERGTTAGSRVLPLAEIADGTAPYFSIILVPGRQGAR